MDITEAQVDALARALRGGSDLETSCHYAGVSIPLVYKWFERGKVESERVANGAAADPSEAECLKFWDEMKKARADAIVRNVAHVQQAAQNGSWQAAAWWLERTVPESYGRNTQRPQAVDTGANAAPKPITE